MDSLQRILRSDFSGSKKNEVKGVKSCNHTSCGGDARPMARPLCLAFSTAHAIGAGLSIDLLTTARRRPVVRLHFPARRWRSEVSALVSHSIAGLASLHYRPIAVGLLPHPRPLTSVQLSFLRAFLSAAFFPIHSGPYILGQLA
jgi:hypothetical protein